MYIRSNARFKSDELRNCAAANLQLCSAGQQPQYGGSGKHAPSVHADAPEEASTRALSSGSLVSTDSTSEAIKTLQVRYYFAALTLSLHRDAI